MKGTGRKWKGNGSEMEGESKGNGKQMDMDWT